jgi:hypothetical protein
VYLLSFLPYPPQWMYAWLVLRYKLMAFDPSPGPCIFALGTKKLSRIISKAVEFGALKSILMGTDRQKLFHNYIFNSKSFIKKIIKLKSNIFITIYKSLNFSYCTASFLTINLYKYIKGIAFSRSSFILTRHHFPFTLMP